MITRRRWFGTLLACVTAPLAVATGKNVEPPDRIIRAEDPEGPYSEVYHGDTGEKCNLIVKAVCIGKWIEVCSPRFAKDGYVDLLKFEKIPGNWRVRPKQTEVIYPRSVGKSIAHDSVFDFTSRKRRQS